MAHLFVADLESAQFYPKGHCSETSQHSAEFKMADLVFMSFPPRFKVFKYIHLPRLLPNRSLVACGAQNSSLGT